jgi:metal-responsive CopG/Arc/MetJ family transcriptional regulator
MRTTVNLDDDVVAAVDQVRRRRGLGFSAAVNELARAGMAKRAEPKQFVQKTSSVGLKIDVTNVAEALEELEGPLAR